MEEQKPLRGGRKMRGFYVTMTVSVFTFVSALMLGVTFTGDNVVTIILAYSVLAGAFFGANFGEHWAKAKNGRVTPNT